RTAGLDRAERIRFIREGKLLQDAGTQSLPSGSVWLEKSKCPTTKQNRPGGASAMALDYARRPDDDDLQPRAGVSREDPLTTHACPGKNVRKLEMIQAVSDLIIAPR